MKSVRVLIPSTCLYDAIQNVIRCAIEILPYLPKCQADPHAVQPRKRLWHQSCGKIIVTAATGEIPLLL